MNTPEKSFEDLKYEAKRAREAAKQRVASVSNGISSGLAETKGKIHDTLDWRTQVRNHPLVVGAAAVVVGYAAARLLKGQMGGGQHAASGASRQIDDDVMMSSYAKTGGNGTSTPQATARPSLLNTVTHSTLVTNLGQKLLNEVEKVGREMVIPAIIGLVTSKVSAIVDGQKNGTQSASQPGAQTNYMR